MGKKANRSGGRYARERYRNESRARKNKRLREERHLKYIISIKKNSALVKDLIEQCTKTFNLPTKNNRHTYVLKRLIGTVNKQRLEKLLSGTIVQKEWYKKRKRTNILDKILLNTKISKDYLEVLA